MVLRRSRRSIATERLQPVPTLLRPLPEDAGPRRVQAIMLTQEEADYLADSKRCDRCGHLFALHNDHCCSFCMISGCRCED